MLVDKSSFVQSPKAGELLRAGPAGHQRSNVTNQTCSVAGRPAGPTFGELLVVEAENQRLEAEILALQMQTCAGQMSWGQ